MSISLLKRGTFQYFPGILARKLTKTFFCNKHVFSIFCHPDVANFRCVFPWWYYHFLNFFYVLVSNTYFKGVHYQVLCWNSSFGNNFYVPYQQRSSSWAKALQRQSFLERKFLLVEMFPEFWPFFHSFKMFMILISYLFTWSLSVICSALVEHLIFAFLIQ